MCACVRGCVSDWRVWFSCNIHFRHRVALCHPNRFGFQFFKRLLNYKAFSSRLFHYLSICFCFSLPPASRHVGLRGVAPTAQRPADGRERLVQPAEPTLPRGLSADLRRQRVSLTVVMALVRDPTGVFSQNGDFSHSHNVFASQTRSGLNDPSRTAAVLGIATARMSLLLQQQQQQPQEQPLRHCNR